MIPKLRNGWLLLLALGAFAGLVFANAPSSTPLATVRMSAGPSFLVALGEARGDFRAEGVAIEVHDYHEFVPEDCELYKPLNDGQLDASIHWFQHVFMGAGDGKPIEGIMLFNDAAGMSVLVANRVKVEIKTPADFKGRRIAEGVPLSTKSFVTNYLTVKAGLPPHRYTSVMQEADGRLGAIIKGLHENQVDVITCMEPMTSKFLATGLVSPLYDLTTRDATTKVLGATLPAQCLLMAPSFVKAHPDIAQKLVNALTRTMRFVNTHSVDEIFAALPPEYAGKKGRDSSKDRIAMLMTTFARNDYSFHRADVQLMRDAVFADTLIDDEEGRLRAHTQAANPPVESYYDNRFVERAMTASH